MSQLCSLKHLKVLKMGILLARDSLGASCYQRLCGHFGHVNRHFSSLIPTHSKIGNVKSIKFYKINFKEKRELNSFDGFFKVYRRNFHNTSHRYQKSRQSSDFNRSRKSIVYIISAIGILTVGLSYAAVPLYRIFCQAYGYGGTVQEGPELSSKVELMKSVEDREITIEFTADSAAMVWNFKPDQQEIKVHPGETALAFYIARNPTDRPVVGISTYNVLPFEAGQYFNKIQCFCFEEQMLNPNEEVHMPVFFYIDPEFIYDPKMENVNTITLSYTFFEAKEGMNLPLPSFLR